MAFADLFPPLVGSQLESWYRDNIEPGVLRELANAPAQRQAQLQNEIWQAFRSEQGSSGKNAAQFTAERAQLQARYAGLARSKATQATQAPPERQPPANADEASAEQLYQAIYTQLRTRGNEAASRAAASAGKQAFLAARARGEDLMTAISSAQTVALQTYRTQTGQGGGVTPPPVNGGGGTVGLPDLPPLDMGGGTGGLPDLPPLDMGGGGLPATNIPSTATPTGRSKFDIGDMFGVDLELPDFVAAVPWPQILWWLLSSDDPSSESFLSQLLNRLLGRTPQAINPANCNLMAQYFIDEYPEAAKAVAYFQCGVTNPIGLDKREALAVWHALNLVASGVVVQASPHGCSCSMRSSRGRSTTSASNFTMSAGGRTGTRN